MPLRSSTGIVDAHESEVVRKDVRVNVKSRRDHELRSRGCQLELVGDRLIGPELDLGDETAVLPPRRAHDLAPSRNAGVCVSVRDKSHVAAVVVGKADLGTVLCDSHAPRGRQLVDHRATYPIGVAPRALATGPIRPPASTSHTADAGPGPEASPAKPAAAPAIAAVIPL